MDKSAKKEALKMTEMIMQMSLYYCKDPDDEIQAYSIRINNLAHELSVLIKRRLIDRTDN